MASSHLRQKCRSDGDQALNTSCADDQLDDADMWAARLRSFACRAMACPLEYEAQIVREGATLIDAGSAVLNADAVDFDRLETMLNCKAMESAVLSLMPDDTVFMLSQGQGRTCLATVIAGSGAEEIICEGPSVALTLLTAYISALLVPLERQDLTSRMSARQPLTRLQ
jgi:hypothetical protein